MRVEEPLHKADTAGEFLGHSVSAPEKCNNRIDQI